jgi:cytosine/adenosine deaminase-related metal-dependent hydrolase
MALVMAGTIAALTPGAEDDVFPGRVWLSDDGTIDAVTRGNAAGPSGFDTAPVVNAGPAVIYPGLVDLHSHLGYNTLPLWSDPGQTTPYLHHDSWPGEPTYKPDVSWPAWTLAAQAPEALLAYVQVRALAGGTTSIQGWPSTSRPASNRLVRCVDNDAMGSLADPVRVYSLTLKPEELGSRRTAMQAGSVFIYHCAEGQPGSIVGREFKDLDQQGCLQQRMVAIHTTALGSADYDRWRTRARQVSANTPFGTVVWSPFSNLWLYGVTTDVPHARSAGLTVCLGTDWGPSGTHNLLGEAKVARLHSDATDGWDLTDSDIAQMMTCLPGDVLGRAWQKPAGRLVPGALGDVVVIDQRRADPWASLVAARERDVRLVVVGGQPRWGTSALMSAAGAVNTTSVRIGSVSRRLTLVRPDDTTKTWAWSDVLARLDAVRASAAQDPPAGPGASRRAVAARGTSADPPGTPPIVIDLDMPGGPQAVAGPPPKGQLVEIPAIEAIYHNAAWLSTIHGRGFHGNALDGLAAAFR